MAVQTIKKKKGKKVIRLAALQFRSSTVITDETQRNTLVDRKPSHVTDLTWADTQTPGS